MNLSLTSLVPTLVWLAVAISGLAIGLGRRAPSLETPPTRHAAVPRYQGVNGRVFSDREYQPNLIDRATGAIVRVDVPAEDVLDYPACSPWQDEAGRFQIVCRWMQRSGRAEAHLPQEFGLARFTFPEVGPIDRVVLDVLPVAEPCWVPGRSPQILFIAGDGQIYRYGFGHGQAAGARPGPGSEAEPARARRISWQTKMPGTGTVHFRDLIHPATPQLGGRLIASIWYLADVRATTRFVGSQLWWFELSDDGSTITAAGRLTPPEAEAGAGAGSDDNSEGAGPSEEERLPSVAVTADGGLTLAYLHRMREQGLWELRTAPLVVDPATGRLRVRREEIRNVTQSCVATAPAFSLDGRAVYGVLDTNSGGAGIISQRFALAGGPAGPPGGEPTPRLVRSAPPRHAR
jgi:hypothetical protein